MKAKLPRLKCGHCEGKGTVELDPEIKKTFALFDHRNELTTFAVHKRLNTTVTHSAINQRLETLRAIGVLQRERRGRVYFYWRTRPEKTAEAAPQN